MEDDSDGIDSHDTFVDLKQLNKSKSIRKQNSVKETIIAENSETCFYFYQVVNGENLFLDPLCLEMLNHERCQRLESQFLNSNAAATETATNTEEIIDLPRLITGKVVEMKSGGMNINGHAQDCDFLGHLPPASSYILVELDMSTTLA